jgi:hypothetical protein
MARMRTWKGGPSLARRPACLRRVGVRKWAHASRCAALGVGRWAGLEQRQVGAVVLQDTVPAALLLRLKANRALKDVAEAAPQHRDLVDGKEKTTWGLRKNPE